MPRRILGDQRKRHRSQLGRKAGKMRGKTRRGGYGSRTIAATSTKNPQSSSSINEKNRKTEICRNWEKGICTFGGRCAFAHGQDEIKRKTLKDLEQDGRIPDASKHHAFPCMSWVATGACSYGRGCVFIHDIRIKGRDDALPRAAYGAKIGGSGPGGLPRAFSITGVVSDNGGSFFFPDIPKDPDSVELAADEVRYDIRPGRKFSTAFKLWYYFVSACIEWSPALISDTTKAEIPANTSEITSRDDSSITRALSSSATDGEEGVRYDDPDAISFPAPTVTTGSTTHEDGRIGIATGKGSGVNFAASFASIIRGSPEPRRSAGERPSPSSSVLELGRPQHGLPRRCDKTDDTTTFKPLPVFEGLRNRALTGLDTPSTGHHALTPPYDARAHGNGLRVSPGLTSPTNSSSPVTSSRADSVALPLPAVMIAVDGRDGGGGDDDDDNDNDNDKDSDDGDSYASCPSSSSPSSSSSSPSSDSYLSCRLLTSPSLSWRSAGRSPVTGCDTTGPASRASSHDDLQPALLHGGCEGAVSGDADAKSRSQSGSAPGEEQGHPDDGIGFLHRCNLALTSPTRTATRGRTPGEASGRLPVFVGLHSDPTYDSFSSRDSDPRGFGVLDLWLSDGRGGVCTGEAASCGTEMSSKEIFFDNASGGSLGGGGGVADACTAAMPAEISSAFFFSVMEQIRLPQQHQLRQP